MHGEKGDLHVHLYDPVGIKVAQEEEERQRDGDTHDQNRGR